MSHNSQLITTILSIFSDSEIITTIPSIYIEGLTKYCVQWTSHDNIALSNSSSSILSKLAILNLKSCDEVIEGIMEYLHQPLDTTVRMRYLGIVSEIMATGKEEWFAICLRRGATDEVLKACEIPDILAQVVL